MKNYQKPIVLPNSDLSEGVYTASGDVRNYTISMGTDGAYIITTTNTSGGDKDSFIFTIPTSGNITNITLSSGEGTIGYTINGGSATITYNPEKPVKAEAVVRIALTVNGGGRFVI